MVSEKKIYKAFSHYKSMGAICCHGTRVPIQSAQKPYAAFPSA